jgi:hypothetical protein
MHLFRSMRVPGQPFVKVEPNLVWRRDSVEETGGGRPRRRVKVISALLDSFTFTLHLEHQDWRFSKCSCRAKDVFWGSG